VRAFVGADHDAVVLPPAALRLLRSYYTESQHYELVAPSRTRGWLKPPATSWASACRKTGCPGVAGRH